MLATLATDTMFGSLLCGYTSHTSDRLSDLVIVERYRFMLAVEATDTVSGSLFNGIAVC